MKLWEVDPLSSTTTAAGLSPRQLSTVLGRAAISLIVPAGFRIPNERALSTSTLILSNPAFSTCLVRLSQSMTARLASAARGRGEPVANLNQLGKGFGDALTTSWARSSPVE